MSKSIKRCLMVLAAASAALPFKSVPEEAAVGEEFGTLSVRAAEQATVSTSTLNSSADLFRADCLQVII